jgi:hypothetical protein
VRFQVVGKIKRHVLKWKLETEISWKILQTCIAEFDWPAGAGVALSVVRKVEISKKYWVVPLLAWRPMVGVGELARGSHTPMTNFAAAIFTSGEHKV